MPDDVKQENVVEAYRDYYIKYKKDFAKWTNRKVPDFMIGTISEIQDIETHAGYAS